MVIHQPADIVDYDETAEQAEDKTHDTNLEDAQDTTEYGDDVAQQGNYVTIHSTGFRDFFLKAPLLRAIGDAGFEHPSEVQHETIPHAVSGCDVLCQAKSGMGKTAVFVISLLQTLEIDKLNLSAGEVACLVISHTRELAFQIKNEFDRFSKHMDNVRVEVVYGGTNRQEDVKKLNNPRTSPHILVGTPGRLLDLAKSNAINLDKLTHFVVDECDKVLQKVDMRRDVQNIFFQTPKRKQVLMFTATLDKDMRKICTNFMSKPIEVSVDDESKLTLNGLLQYYVKLDEKQKNRKLTDVLDELDFNQVIIFVKSVSRANALNGLLKDCNFPSICIHSGMQQQDRIDKYQAFKNYEARILVSTDLFGRGIDIERVNIVINYDLPDSTDSYLHRVGRAGRFGTKGLAISFVANEEEESILSDVQARFEVKVAELPAEIPANSYITT